MPHPSDTPDAHARPNSLEAAIEQARSGALDMAGLLRLFVASTIAVPSASAVDSDGSGFEPLMFDRDGTPMIACFTQPAKFGAFAAKAPYCIAMAGGEFLRRIAPGVGMVVNPGQAAGFEVPPEGVARAVRDFVQG